MIDDSVRAALLEMDDPRDAEAAVACLYARFGKVIADSVLRQQYLAGGQQPRPFRRGCIDASKLPPPGSVQRLWPGFYPGKVTYIIGQTNIGKSSILYNWALSAILNWPLWDIDYGLGQPLKGLYVDPENAGNWEAGIGGVCSRKVARIVDFVPPDRLYFSDGEDLNLYNGAHFQDLEETIVERGAHFCILDPIINMYETVNENDNAEAARQFKALQKLARRTNCCIVAVHHLGADNTSMFGRGATSRASNADVVIAIRMKAAHSADEVDDDYNGATHQRIGDLVRFQSLKNRCEGGFSVFLRMEGDDRFSRVTFDDWKRSKDNSPGAPVSRTEQCVTELYHTLGYQTAWTTEALLTEALSGEGFGKSTIKTAITKALRDGFLQEQVAIDGSQPEYRMIPAKQRTADARPGRPTESESPADASTSLLEPEPGMQTAEPPDPFDDEEDAQWYETR